MSVSLQQIASKVGVSKAAVSLALRNNPRISVARRKEIQQIALDMGYEPNMLARGLTGGRTCSIGVLWPTAEGPHRPFYTAQDIALKIQEHGYMVSIADISDAGKIEKIVSDYIKRHFDGIILHWIEPYPLDEWLLEKLKKFSACVIVCPKAQVSPFDEVVQDRTYAMLQVAEHLHAAGRRKPFIVISYKYKLDSYIQALMQFDIVVPKEAIIENKINSLDDIAACLDNHFSLNKMMPDVIICNNDEQAIAVAAWVRSKNLRIPEDIAIIGFNDSAIAKFQLPPIASVAREDDKMVDAAVRMLFARLQNSQMPQQREVIAMKFVWRQSAG